MTAKLGSIVCLAVLCWSTVARAQLRPSEDQLFGTPTDTSPAVSQPPVRVVPADPIAIGGQIYLRARSTALEHQEIEDYAFSMPALLDMYFDARPNDRVRGFVLGRLSYDPMLPDAVSMQPGAIGTSASDSGTSGSASLSSLFGSGTNAPRALLDQLWLRFDLGRVLYVTAGRQHVRWGTSRFWMPADLLHFQRRNPLDLFDARPGTDMLKLHLPITAAAWNLYAYAIAGGHNDTPTLYSISAAARAELVLGSNELGLGALVRRGARPKLAADLSMALGPIDFYGEAALLDAGEIDRVSYKTDAVLGDELAPNAAMSDRILSRIAQAIETYYPAYRDRGYKPQAVAGFTITQPYGDNDVFTFGVEYFYNGLGYRDASAYPGLLFPRLIALRDQASFFYLGQHYAAVFIGLPAPFALDLHTFTISTLCNISDRSCIARFDYTVQALTHLRFELFVAGVFGSRNGEFTFGIETPVIDEIRLGREPAIFHIGLALRIGV